MFTISLRNLWEHKLRTLLLGGAITVGVAFVVASFVLTDSIGDAFDEVFAEAFSAIDIQVSGDIESAGDSFEIPLIPGDLAEEIAAVPGVTSAHPELQTFIFIEDVDGGGGFGGGFGPPSFGVSWSDGPSPFLVVDGVPPSAADEVAIDVDGLESLDLAIGDTARIAAGAGRYEEFEVVGAISYGESNALFGVTFAAFEFDRAAEFFGTGDEVSGYAVATDPDVDVDTVVTELNEAVLPEGAMAVNARTAAEEQSADFREGISFITTFLLVFAGISLLVGGFVVYNAFQVVLAQRTRELGLLRVLGATRGNILSMVISEAALLGLGMSVLGIPVGWGVAWLARAALQAFGGSIPSTTLSIAPRTAMIAIVVGTVVALGSAVLPARRANRVSPMAALRDQPELENPRRWVWIVGAVGVAASLGLLLWAALAAQSGEVFSGDTDALIPVGIGAFGLFLGLVLASRALARPVIGTIGRPLASVTGRLARENARRSPARTATTATSLMIGVGLVVMVAILTTSLQDTIDEAITESFRGDMIISTSTFGFGGGMPPEVREIVESVDGVETAAGSNLLVAESEAGADLFISGLEPDTIDLFFTIDEVDGSLEPFEGHSIAVDAPTADAQGLALGDDVALIVDGETLGFELVAILTFGSDFSDGQTFILPYSTVAELDPDGGDAQLIVVTEDGTDVETVQDDIDTALEDFANIQVTSIADLSRQIEAGIGGVQVLLTVLLLVSVFVALFGIVLTLYLAVFERTHEIGLLRAIGMTRDQLGSTIRWEAVLIALFGTVLGLALGLAAGWALTAALLGEDVILSVPWLWIAGSLVGGAIAGFFASLIPATAAARMNVLDAIAYE